MAQHGFVKGAEYTRAEVAEAIGLPQHRRRGGNWSTGYDTFDGEAFIFCNVGTAGRTGHDYPNRWDGAELIWYGKRGTHRNQPLMREITGGGMPVHIFWRESNTDPFAFAGTATPVDIADTVPVRVRWRFVE